MLSSKVEDPWSSLIRVVEIYRRKIMTYSKLTPSIYHPMRENKWTGTNWSKVEKTIENLQHRITKATEKGEHRKVRNLQRLLIRSFSARLKAVRIVAQEN